MMLRESGSPSSCNRSAAKAYPAGSHLRRLKIRPRERLVAYAMRLRFTPADAEDLVQDAYLLLLKHVQSGKPIPDFFAYLVGCINGRAATVWARDHRRARILGQQPLPPDADPSPEDHLLASIMVHYILKGLSVADAGLLRWRYLADRSTREVAEHLDIPEGAARTRLHRALTKAQGMVMAAKDISGCATSVTRIADASV